MEVGRVVNEVHNLDKIDFSPRIEIRSRASSKESGVVDNAFDPTLLRRVVDQIKSTFNMFDTRLHFRVNMDANSVVVEVVDSRTNAVLKQIPSEEMQELKMKLQELSGALIDVKA